MMPAEALFEGGLAAYRERLRRGELTVEAATQTCLARITETNDRLKSFVHVAEDAALETARGLDRLLAAGVDLGPLMGVPVGVKDLYSVAGMPTCVGSRIDLADILEPEGGFVRALRRAGCVILGKTRTTEFAMGGINLSHPTPWNPRDPMVHRTPGGSSAGSAVAVAAGQCAFAIGSDTGGSVRQPAALCGLAGFKASADLWPLDGIFALSPTLDSIGWLTASVADAAYIFGELCGATPPVLSIRRLRLGRPSLHGFAELDPDVAEAFEAAVLKLKEAGADIVPMEVPELREVDDLGPIVALELIGRLGRVRLEAARELIDPVPWARLVARLDAADYIGLLHKCRRLRRTVRQGMQAAALDGWITPTVPHTATSLIELKDAEAAATWNGHTFRITRLANLFDQCAISIPLPVKPGGLPTGFQLVCHNGGDERLLGMAVAIEQSIAS